MHPCSYCEVFKQDNCPGEILCPNKEEYIKDLMFEPITNMLETRVCTLEEIRDITNVFINQLIGDLCGGKITNESV
jgi:hypothetical protein